MKRTKDISILASHLRAGGLVAFPTETVYGLGADARDDNAVAAIYAAKGRPQFNPLIVHVDRFETAQKYGVFSETATRLANHFWPGPLTLVLPRVENCPISLLASAGLDSLAIRVPAHPLAQELLMQYGGPLVAPSANPSGQISPTKASHVVAGLGDKVDYVLDGGDCAVGVESTIVSCLGDVPVILRHGGLVRGDIEQVLGFEIFDGADAPSAPSAPGQLTSHYAPSATMRLNATSLQDGEALLGFGDIGPLQPKISLNLSPKGDLQQAAANLFAMMTRLDEMLDEGDVKKIAVSPIPNHGLGEAINDRLNRAAAPRSRREGSDQKSSGQDK